jgi:hypothetical protein
VFVKQTTQCDGVPQQPTQVIEDGHCHEQLPAGRINHTGTAVVIEDANKVVRACGDQLYAAIGFCRLSHDVAVHIY